MAIWCFSLCPYLISSHLILFLRHRDLRYRPRGSGTRLFLGRIGNARVSAVIEHDDWFQGMHRRRQEARTWGNHTYAQSSSARIRFSVPGADATLAWDDPAWQGWRLRDPYWSQAFLSPESWLFEAREYGLRTVVGIISGLHLRARYRVFALRVEHCISPATFTRTPQYQFSPIIRPSMKLNKLPY